MLATTWSQLCCLPTTAFPPDTGPLVEGAATAGAEDAWAVVDEEEVAAGAVVAAAG